MRDIRRMGSAALDLCSVAAGRLDAYVEEGLNVWDHGRRRAGRAPRPARGSRCAPGVGGNACFLCAPEDGFDEFRDLVGTDAVSWPANRS